MIYFDRIEVVNYLIPSAGNLTSVQPAKNINQCVYPKLPVHLVSQLTWHGQTQQMFFFFLRPNVCFSLSEPLFSLCSVRHSEELHRGLRQSFDIQQGSP